MSQHAHPSRIAALRLLMGTLILLAGVLMQASATLNHDVAWFAFGARAWWRGATIGTDLTDPNFPLAYLLYLPAVALAKVMGLAWGAKLWALMLAAGSTMLAWPTVAPRVRPVLFITLGLYIVLAWPHEFAQREQLAMLLVLPYVLGAQRQGWPALLSGVMAGIGLAVKPHFLIVLLLLEAPRLQSRIELRALLATLLGYGIALLTVFHAFTTELLPAILHSYGAFNRPQALLNGTVPAGFALLSLAFASGDPLARRLALAAIGFALAGIAQMKFYPYHFIPAWGFTMLALATIIQREGPRLRRLMPAGLLLASMLLLAPPTIAWWTMPTTDRDDSLCRLSVWNNARTFTVTGVYPYPAFPTALCLEARGVRYVGQASSHWFLPGAAAGNPLAMQRARAQAEQELAEAPDLVIVDTDWSHQTQMPATFDGLRWLRTDPRFAEQWAAYREVGRHGAFRLFRRRDAL